MSNSSAAEKLPGSVRRKVLITGGSGTVGMAFMKEYRDEFEFFNVSRNESYISQLSQAFPETTSFVADVRDVDRLINLFLKVKPDIVIHAAALKHVNHAELNPSKTVEVNILGSLNVIQACIRAEVPITVAISTDKACRPENIYGYSKKITEQMFLEHYNMNTKFACARFANVAASNGSVIPFWIKCARNGEPLKLTDSRMNRLMFTAREASKLIRQTIAYTEESKEAFVLSRIMKSVNMLELANVISRKFGDGSQPQVMGMRPGERLNETLVSQPELSDAYITRDGEHIALHTASFGGGRLTQELSSLTADYMDEKDIHSLFDEYTQSLQGSTGAIIEKAVKKTRNTELVAEEST